MYSCIIGTILNSIGCCSIFSQFIVIRMENSFFFRSHFLMCQNSFKHNGTQTTDSNAMNASEKANFDVHFLYFLIHWHFALEFFITYLHCMACNVQCAYITENETLNMNFFVGFGLTRNLVLCASKFFRTVAVCDAQE